MIQLDVDLCQSVTLFSLLVIDRDGIIGKQCGLGRYKYRNTQLHKDKNTEKSALITFSFFVYKSYHEKMTPGYT